MPPGTLTMAMVLFAAGDAGSPGQGVSGASTTSPAVPSAPASSVPSEPRLPTTAFSAERQPRARRTKDWTRPLHGFSPRWERSHPGVHFSRFLDLARPDLHPPTKPRRSPTEWHGALSRFAKDVVADLRDALDVACPPRHCAPTIAEADKQLATFQAVGGRQLTVVDRSNTQDPANAWYGWRLTSDTLSVDVGCQDWSEAAEVACTLEMVLVDGRVLTYRPGVRMTDSQPDIAIREDGEADGRIVGEIRFERTFSGAPVVILTGEAIAPEPAKKAETEPATTPTTKPASMPVTAP
jgi:hypothetical protein